MKNTQVIKVFFAKTILREFFAFGVSCFDKTNLIWINFFSKFQTKLNFIFLIKIKFNLRNTKHDKRKTKIHEPLLEAKSLYPKIPPSVDALRGGGIVL